MQERDTKILEGEGGLWSIINKPATLLKYGFAAIVLGQFSKDTHAMFGVAHADT